jgi:ADP-heptose:LPS heptosyltransferase
MCPLSSKPTKDFAPDRWAEALQQVADLIPAGGLRLAGGPDQAEQLQEFADALRSAGVSGPIHVEEAVALPDFPASMARAALILTVDTSAAHLACAIGAPAVIVVSGHNMEIYGGYSPNGRQQWVMGVWARGRKKTWQETVSNEAVVAGIRRALA